MVRHCHSPKHLISSPQGQLQRPSQPPEMTEGSLAKPSSKYRFEMFGSQAHRRQGHSA
jgi:hypothetical protein